MFKWYHVLTVELLFTFMLCFVVLNTACIKKDNQYFGLAIGFVIVAGGNAGGWIRSLSLSSVDSSVCFGGRLYVCMCVCGLWAVVCVCGCVSAREQCSATAQHTLPF